MVRIKADALAALATFFTSSAAHSWVEQLMVINGQGQFTGTPGYARNNTMRTQPGFSDPLMVHILPGQGQPAIEQRDTSSNISSVDTVGITPTDQMCKKTQQQQHQTNGSPRLSAPAGSLIALRYEENGHVTLPQNQLGKPANRGTVYIYGTTQPKQNENFLDVFKQWTADGTGGDKRGKLIATQPFDDGHCYQMNSGTISQQRQQQFPHAASTLMGTDLWCQNDIKLPTDAVSGKPYTLYWVWDWPTEPNVDPGLPKGKAEIYTTCMDIDVTVAQSKARHVKVARAMQAQASNSAINNAAIPSYMSSLAASGAGAPATQAAASKPAASAPAASAPAASAPVASAPAGPASAAPAPAASAPAAAAPMNAAEAAEIITAALASLVAAESQPTGAAGAAGPATVTVTASAQPTMASATQGGSAGPAASSSINGISQEAAMASAAPQAPQPSPAAPVASAASSPAPAPAMSQAATIASAPPSSMDIQAPAGLSGTAAAASAAAPTGNSAPVSSPFTGTASPVSSAATSASPASSAAAASAAPALAGRSCAKCKAAKRSRILGSA